MKVSEAREIIKGMELSQEANAKIDQILIEFGEEEVSEEAVDKILKIIDVEMDATKLAGDIYQSGAQMADEFLKNVDGEAGKIADEIEEKVKGKVL